MTSELAKSIVDSSVRCTQATLRAFGIEDAIPKTGSGCLEYLTSRGFTCKRITFVEGITLKGLKTIHGLKEGMYLINTHGHAIALIDGILVDTENKGFDNRIVEFCWHVLKPSTHT